MKKIISLLITMVVSLSCLGCFGVSVSAEETVTKNYEYFASLTDEEVFEEYKIYCAEVGKTVEDAVIEDGIIKSGAICDYQGSIAYGAIDMTTIEINFEKGKRPDEDELSDKTMEYYGFNEEHKCYVWNPSFTDYLITISASINDNVYEALRNIMTLYYSDFYNDYGKYITHFDFLLLDGGSFKYGDVNCDGVVSLTDAVSLNCHLANAEKYPIYIMGAEYGDVSNKGDGLTSDDTLAILKYLIRAIDSLPESVME